MTEQELREKIVQKFQEYDFNRHGIKFGVLAMLADEILALIREAGYVQYGLAESDIAPSRAIGKETND